ncbi:unnamed protein product, partial [Darwinula stevensoni]
MASPSGSLGAVKTEILEQMRKKFSQGLKKCASTEKEGDLDGDRDSGHRSSERDATSRNSTSGMKSGKRRSKPYKGLTYDFHPRKKSRRSTKDSHSRGSGGSSPAVLHVQGDATPVLDDESNTPGQDDEATSVSANGSEDPRDLQQEATMDHEMLEVQTQSSDSEDHDVTNEVDLHPEAIGIEEGDLQEEMGESVEVLEEPPEDGLEDEKGDEHEDLEGVVEDLEGEETKNDLEEEDEEDDVSEKSVEDEEEVDEENEEEEYGEIDEECEDADESVVGQVVESEHGNSEVISRRINIGMTSQALPLSKKSDTLQIWGKDQKCCCAGKEHLMAYSEESKSGQTIFCSARDSLDDKIVGCRNVVKNPELLRPHSRIPYLTFCEVHRRRLHLHQCCPSCGLFCTQGHFWKCEKENGTGKEMHFFHKECGGTIERKDQEEPFYCLHCGETETVKGVRLELRTLRNLVFYPQQAPPKIRNWGPMTFVKGEKKEGHPKDLPSWPVIPVNEHGVAYSIPEQGIKISLDNIPWGPDDPSAAEDLKKLIEALKTQSYKEMKLESPDLYQFASDGENEKLLYCIFALLHQAGALLDARDEHMQTPLMLAADLNHASCIRYLLCAGASVYLRGEDGMTALHLAARSGHLEACYLLLNLCSDPRSLINNQDYGGWTPLVWSAENKHRKVTRFLLQQGADPQICDMEGNTALHWAAYSGSTDIASICLRMGCFPNLPNLHGDTPVHIAARRDHPDCVLLLLLKDARLDVRNKDGQLPLDCASYLPPTSQTYQLLYLNQELRKLRNMGQGNNRRLEYRILSNDISRGKERIPVQCVNEVDDEPLPKDYKYMTENLETPSIHVNRTISSIQIFCSCDGDCSSAECQCAAFSIRCWYDDEGRLLPDFNYADPPLLFECNRACQCHVKLCRNRVFQRGIMIQMELYKTGSKGWGVKTLEAIPKGTYVCE